MTDSADHDKAPDVFHYSVMNTVARKAVVLAAGKSSRIAPLAGTVPKPLLEIGGQPILVRNLRWLAESEIEEVWINLHYRPEAIRERIGDGCGLGLQVNYSYEPEILRHHGRRAPDRVAVERNLPRGLRRQLAERKPWGNAAGSSRE